LKEDESDAGKQIQKLCDLILPDPELKSKLWNQIVDSETKDSLKDLNLKMEGFF